MANDNDDRAIRDAGYVPQLKRSLGLFAAFAIPFSEISITTGIFANFGFVLTKAGAFGFWTWPLVAIGNMLVALIFAELAGRIPLTGSCYNWNNKLGYPMLGWFSGWLAASCFTIGIAGVTTTIIPILSVISGHDIDPMMGCYISAALIITQLLINLISVRMTSHINIVAVIAEIAGIIGLTVLLGFAVAHHGHFNTALLTTIPAEPKPYWQGFLLASLLGAWTMVGFECAVDVSEETINASRITPKGMVMALAASAVIGFVFIVVMALSIFDTDEVAKASYPLAAIASHYLGERVTQVFLIFAVIAMFACAMVCMTAASRNIFAMARDGCFVESGFFKKVSTHHVPKGPLYLVAIVSIGFTFMTDSATSLYGAATVCSGLYYLMTVISFALNTGKLPQTSTFTLGRWHWPVVIGALVWLVFEIGVLTIPEEFHSVALATGGVAAIGILLYPFVGRLKRQL